MENLSFNYDNTGNNTANETVNEPVLNTQQNEEIFDELAMLCSGQFKTSQKCKDKKDVYQFDDEDDDDLDEEEKLIRKFRKEEKIEEDDEEEETKDQENETSDEDEDDEEIDEEIEIRDEETRPKSREQKLKIKKKRKEEYKKALEKEGFFEEEAELSGDEKDEDEDFDGDSADDSIVCSGDEDNLPSDSELKEQLGRIYQKDKMDEENRQLRLIKEMYLVEKDEKNSRRKNFRWKHIDDNLGIGFHSDSSGEEEEATDEADGKTNNFFKSVANGDWRSNRHEREQFVKQNVRKENLLSDDDDEEEKDEEEEDNCLRIFGSSANQPGNQLLKKGQMLLKKRATYLKPSVAQKRPFEDDKANQSRIIVQKRVEAKKKEQKFSFLSRDKSYLSRISNYVNKNLTEKVSFKTVRPNNMVFSVIDPVPQMNDENKNIQVCLLF